MLAVSRHPVRPEFNQLGTGELLGPSVKAGSDTLKRSRSRVIVGCAENGTERPLGAWLSGLLCLFNLFDLFDCNLGRLTLEPSCRNPEYDDADHQPD